MCVGFFSLALIELYLGKWAECETEVERLKVTYLIIAIVLTMVFALMLGCYYFGIFMGDCCYNSFQDFVKLILKKNLNFYRESRIGEIITISSRDLEILELYISKNIVFCISLGFSLMIGFAFIAYLNPYILPLLLCLLAVCYYFYQMFLNTQILLR